MHRHVRLLIDINDSVTDELPIKYIVSFDIRLPIFEAFSTLLDDLHSEFSRGACPYSAQVVHA